MKFNMNIGQGFVQFGEKKYSYEDANKEVSEYTAFTHNKSFFPTHWWEMLIVVIVGKMASGKSTYSEGFNFLLWHLYGDTEGGYEAYNVNDLAFAMSYLNREENIENRKKVLLLNVDDSMSKEVKGTNSLRTMAKENMDLESLISMWRHELANEDEKRNPDPRVENGFGVLIFNIQDPKRLSTMVRRNADIIIYKTAYKDLKKEMNQDDWEYLANISEASSKAIYPARSLSLIETDTKFMKWYIPRVPKQFVDKYPKLRWLLDDGKYDPYEKMFNELKEVYEEDWRFYELESWIYNWCSGKNLNYSSNLNQEIKRRIVYWQKFERDDEEEDEEDEAETTETEAEKDDEANKLDYKKIHKLRLEGCSYASILSMLDINLHLVTLSKKYQIWCLEKNVTAIKDIRNIQEKSEILCES